MADDRLYQVIEIDTFTGFEQALPNYATDPWSEFFTKEEAESTVELRRRTVVSRYDYRIEGPGMDEESGPTLDESFNLGAMSVYDDVDELGRIRRNS